MTRRFLSLELILWTLLVLSPARAAEHDALAISEIIAARHMPYGTILDPVFDPANQIVGYSRCGDSAIWTGHYLAAESFRHAVTRSPESLSAVREALRGIRSLVDVTGTNLLARCLVPTDSPFAAGILNEESHHGSYTGTLDGKPYFWVGNTSRDQYSGVIFGLGVAYDMIDEPDVQTFIQSEVTRILDYLLLHNWSVVMPDGRISTTFLHRLDQQLSFLQVGRRVNPARFGLVYAAYRHAFARFVIYPILFETVDDHNHYFKFNLDYINLFNLIRLEENGPYKPLYMGAYDTLRRRTREHGNAHFNMIDRVLMAENGSRDAETIALLELWLQRLRRDYWIDLRGKYPACGNDRACTPIPVNERVNTEFLWQRSPFLLFGGGLGTIETAGIDYILPYWMARHYGTAR